MALNLSFFMIMKQIFITVSRIKSLNFRQTFEKLCNTFSRSYTILRGIILQLIKASQIENFTFVRNKMSRQPHCVNITYNKIAPDRYKISTPCRLTSLLIIILVCLWWLLGLGSIFIIIASAKSANFDRISKIEDITDSDIKCASERTDIRKSIYRFERRSILLSPV